MLDILDINIIRKIQEDIPIVQEPYKQIAKELGISEDELLDKIHRLCSNGIIRRFGAILNHRNAGFTSNAMVVWNIPMERIKEASKIMVKFSPVSHCYRRPIFPEWPYNIFTMIHGETKEQCEKIVEEISKASKISDYVILYSTCELKKTSMKYFNDEIFHSVF
ncbi:AsnC family transcriptional regulator [Clostridium sp.]|jgi:DNA-binding Lrp family transcriptional regulator|uniref:siroheme decarboxylase subunit beta n=1 Tax=Clostridium sp. TaxID=1506 RepID=UPI0025832819|nr:AsnC family transcriptional regulator [Clostridium sp.]MDF2504919.1 transcriptional regulator [Clostridium sp.]